MPDALSDVSIPFLSGFEEIHSSQDPFATNIHSQLVDVAVNRLYSSDFRQNLRHLLIWILAVESY